MRPFLICLLLVVGMAPSVQAQPVSLRGDLELEATSDALDGVRLAYDPTSERLLVASLGGNVFSVDPDVANKQVTLLYTPANHGVPAPLMGMDVAQDGTIYLVGNDAGSQPGYNIGVIKRGRLGNDGNRTWETVATTAPYPRSNTNYDHNMNAVVLSPDEQFLFVNSGSRTDHGEEQSNNGQFPGVREVPLTSAIFRIPVDATGLLLPDDEALLRQGGYLYADGTRNSFSMAFDAEGQLYALENSGDRDDSEEMNRIVEGGHYGFPWRIALEATPMQFPDYDPSADLLLNPAAGAVQDGHFHNDPDYPAPPPGVTFSDPVLNVGPDADLYRDPVTGAIRDASDDGVVFGTFTSHRSPLGLVFDTEGALPDSYMGDALALGWTGSESPLLGPFSGEGEDLLHLTFVPGSNGTSISTERIASGFQNPIDAELVGASLYILEFGNGGRVWEVRFTRTVTTDPAVPVGSPSLTVFPNPMSGQARIRISSGRTGRARAGIYAVDGRQMGTLQFVDTIASGETEVSLDMSAHPPGVYFVRVEVPGQPPARTSFVHM